MDFGKNGIFVRFIGSVIIFMLLFALALKNLTSDTMVIAIGTLLYCVLAIIFVLLERRKLAKSIFSLREIIRSYVDGDFLAEINSDYNTSELSEVYDEIVALQKTLKNWLYNTIKAEVMLKEYSQKLRNNSSNSLGSMEIISKHIESILDGSKTISTGSSENAAISEELLGSNTEISEYSSNFKKMTAESIVTIQNDTAMIDDTLDGIGVIGEQMRKTADSINTFKELLDSISNMANAISDISDQTNLLALNASIESARAGEAGRGFAVVANEIKKLADQSSETALDINANISNIKQNVNSTISEINQGVEKSVEIKEKSKVATTNLNKIVQRILDMQDFINNISQNVQEQTKASEVLAENIEKVVEYTTKTDGLTHDMNDKINLQVVHTDENAGISEDIYQISEQFGGFIKNFEKEIDEQCFKTADVLVDLISEGKVNNAFLEKFSINTGISEFYITDKNGKTVMSNNPHGIGFVFSNEPGTQAYDFYRILNEPKLRVAQSMMIRDIDGRYFKFLGVSRKDGAGIVQVGLALEDITKFRGQYALLK